MLLTPCLKIISCTLIVLLVCQQMRAMPHDRSQLCFWQCFLWLSPAPYSFLMMIKVMWTTARLKVSRRFTLLEAQRCLSRQSAWERWALLRTYGIKS